MSNLNENFTIAEPRLCILAAHPTKGLMYRGQTVWDNGEIAIVAHYEKSTDGLEASKLLLMENDHRQYVAWFDELANFKIACHQLRHCHCGNFDNGDNCPAAGLPAYPGPYFDEDVLRDMCYLDFYNDTDTRLLTQVSSATPYVGSLCADIGNDLFEALTLIDIIRACGGKEAHRPRRQD
jgi:hypothetical protein